MDDIQKHIHVSFAKRKLEEHRNAHLAGQITIWGFFNIVLETLEVYVLSHF